MSLIKEHYQDEQGNWLPEAQEILAKATTTQTTTNSHAAPVGQDRRFLHGVVQRSTPRTTMNIELNTAELNILSHAVQMLVCNAKGGWHAREEDSQATGAELLAKLIKALKNAQGVAKAAALAKV